MKLTLKTPKPELNDHTVTISGVTTGKLMALKALLLETNPVGDVQREVRSFLITNITSNLDKVSSQ